MFVIYKVIFDERLNATYEKEKEVKTLDEAHEFIQEQRRRKFVHGSYGLKGDKNEKHDTGFKQSSF